MRFITGHYPEMHKARNAFIAQADNAKRYNLIGMGGALMTWEQLDEILLIQFERVRGDPIEEMDIIDLYEKLVRYYSSPPPSSTPPDPSESPPKT